MNLKIGFISLLLAFMACSTKQKNYSTIETTTNDSLPNIVLIVVDDLGWKDVGFMGSDYYETPNIDKLADQGMYFTDAYAAAAICSPTRAAIMTGKYPARLGITDWIRAKFQGGGSEEVVGYEAREPSGDYWEEEDTFLLCPKNPYHLRKGEITVAEHLKMAGYSTCHIGKWHLGTEGFFPSDQGFQYNIAGCDYGQPPSYFDPYIYGDWYNDTLWGFPTMASRDTTEYLTDREAFEAVQFIENHKDSPFYLNLWHYAVHTPIQAKSDDIAYFTSKKNRINLVYDTAYAAMIKSVDDAVGAVVAKLEALELMENTLILFTSDNGGLKRVTDNTPLRSGKGYPYEGGIRVPFIAHWTGKIKPNTISNEPIISTDILPTICEATETPISTYHTIDGKSLMPTFTTQTPLEREALYWHFPHYRKQDIMPYSIVRAGDWKLIKQYDGQRFQLFNLKEDLSETTDLAQANPTKVNELDQQLVSWLGQVKAKLPKKAD